MANTLAVPEGLEQDTIAHSVRVLTNTFGEDNAFFRFMCLNYMKLPLTTPLTAPLRRVLFHEFVAGMLEEGGMITTVPGSSSTCIWILESLETPQDTNTTADSEGIPESDTNEFGPPILGEMHVKSQALIRKALPQCKKYVHLVITANIRTPELKGSIRARDGFLPMVVMAAKLGLPVYAEGTSDRATGILKEVGFELIGDLRLGVGVVDENGYSQDSGPGVSVSPMILRPEQMFLSPLSNL